MQDEVVYADSTLVIARGQVPGALTISGTLDSRNAGQAVQALKRELRSVYERGREPAATPAGTQLHLDVSRLEFEDTRAIEALVGVAGSTGSGQRLVVRGIAPAIRRVMVLVGWADLPGLLVVPDGCEQSGSYPRLTSQGSSPLATPDHRPPSNHFECQSTLRGTKAGPNVRTSLVALSGVRAQDQMKAGQNGASAPGASSPVDRSRPLVMLVDDDPATGAMYALGVQAGGFRAAVMSDLDSLLLALDTDLPDALVLDFQLGGIVTGVDVLENLRLDDRFAEMPVLMLSNHVGDLDGAIDRARAAGACWHVKSRTTPAELAVQVSDAIKSTRQERDVRSTK